jgi:hypothetical protein
MRGLSRKSLILTIVFATINIIGLAWIHHDLTKTAGATVRVLSASLQPDLDNPDRIRLAFDRDMVADASVGRIEKAAVFQIAPACPGQWTWAARDVLEYLLARPLAEGHLLKVNVTPQLRAVTGRTLEGTGEFQFAARPLQLVSTDIVASDNADITFQVTFNQSVDPGEFLRHATFSDAKTQAKLSEPL